MPRAPDVIPSPVRASLDAPAAPARIGLIALSTDLTTERDAMRLMPPERAALHTARVRYDNPTMPENLARLGPRLTAAADLLTPGVDLAAIIFSCTAASVVIGDDAVADAIAAGRPGVPVVTPPAAALAAFAALGVGRVALLTPYTIETTAPMAAYFQGHGLDIVNAQCLGLTDDREMARISADSIVAAAEAADAPAAEGVFLSCTALPAVGAIERIEDRLGKPVVSSNLATFWQALGHAGVAPAPGAPGRLFRLAEARGAA